jgi:hypothetical protein
MLEVARSREPSIHNLERLLHIDNLRFLHSMILPFFAYRSLIRSCGRMPALHRPRALAPLLSLRSLRPIFTILPTLKKPRRTSLLAFPPNGHKSWNYILCFIFCISHVLSSIIHLTTFPLLSSHKNYSPLCPRQSPFIYLVLLRTAVGIRYVLHFSLSIYIT